MSIPNIKDIIESLVYLIEQISFSILGLVGQFTGASPDSQLILVVVWSVTILVTLFVAILFSFSLLAGWVKFRDDVLPRLWRSKERQDQLARRGERAEKIRDNLNKLIEQESWAGGKPVHLRVKPNSPREPRFPFIFLKWITPIGAEPNLLMALDHRPAKLFYLLGDAAAGKSTTLRLAARQLAERTAKSYNLGARIPIYFNLKNWEPSGSKPDSSQLSEQVFKSINSLLTEKPFSDSEFRELRQNGRFLFFLDSFDEIPAVLNAVDANVTITDYANAIANFAKKNNYCPVVVASRRYRMPNAQGEVIELLPLTASERTQIIQKSNLDAGWHDTILARVEHPPLQEIATNPLLLTLLCHFVQSNNGRFPQHRHEILQAHVEDCLKNSKGELTKEERKLNAQKIAFAMSNDENLGLNPSFPDLEKSLEYSGLTLIRSLEDSLNSLHQVKLGVFENGQGDARRFRFIHRVLQDYFATEFMRANSNRVDPKVLLTNARWRETAVAFLQNQEMGDARRQLLDCAANLVNDAALECENWEPVPKEKESDSNLGSLFLKSTQKDFERWVRLFCQLSVDQESKTPKVTSNIEWPPYLLHILGILQEGLAWNGSKLAPTTQGQVSELLRRGYAHGTTFDKFAAVQIAGVAPNAAFQELVEWGSNDNSQLVRDAAFAQLHHLDRTSQQMEKFLRSVLVQMAARNRMVQEGYKIRVLFSDQQGAESLKNVFRLLANARRIDFILNFAVIVLMALLFLSEPASFSLPAFGILAGFSAFLLGMWWWRWHPETFVIRNRNNPRYDSITDSPLFGPYAITWLVALSYIYSLLGTLDSVIAVVSGSVIVYALLWDTMAVYASLHWDLPKSRERRWKLHLTRPYWWFLYPLAFFPLAFIFLVLVLGAVAGIALLLFALVLGIVRILWRYRIDIGQRILRSLHQPQMPVLSSLIDLPNRAKEYVLFVLHHPVRTLQRISHIKRSRFMWVAIIFVFLNYPLSWLGVVSGDYFFWFVLPMFLLLLMLPAMGMLYLRDTFIARRTRQLRIEELAFEKLIRHLDAFAFPRERKTFLTRLSSEKSNLKLTESEWIRLNAFSKCIDEIVRDESKTNDSLSQLRATDSELVKWLDLDTPSSLDEAAFRAKWDESTRDELARLVKR